LDRDTGKIDLNLFNSFNKKYAKNYVYINSFSKYDDELNLKSQEHLNKIIKNELRILNEK